MRERHVARLGGTRRRMLMIVMVLVVAPLISGGGFASSASAKEPTGDFAPFGQCPRFTAGVNICLSSQITDGVMTLDKLTVPIVNPVTLQFGIVVNEETFEEKVVGALDGETLSPTPQPVPGGLSSLIDCNELKGRGFRGRLKRRACRATLEDPRFATVDMTTELARPASEISVNKHNEEAKEGTALSLPVRIHLENPLLGRECYIGTSTDPIVFDFTDGTTNPPPPNQPITGKAGYIEAKDEFQLAEVTEHVQVDNTFSAPVATGCGYGSFSRILDSLIDNKIGLPSPAGYNTIIHSGTAKEAGTTAVIASEQEDEPGEERHEHKRGRRTGPRDWWR
jgi:hypothetical protein